MIVRIGVVSQSFKPYYDNCTKKFGWNSHRDCPTPGATVEILRELLFLMNASVEFVPVSEEDSGQLVNGSTWTGMLGSIMANDIDTSIYDFSHTQSRLHSFDFSTSILFTPYAFFYKLTDDSFDTYVMSLLKPFNKTLWFSISITIALLLTAWLLISNENKQALSKIFTFVQFLQGDFEERSIKFTRPKAFFFISLSIFTIFFSSLYQGVMLIGFLKADDPVFITKLSELINLLENNRLQVVTEDDEWGFFDRVKSSDGELFEQINEIFTKHKYLKVDSQEEVYKYLMTGRYVYPTYNTNFRGDEDRCRIGFMILDEDKDPSGFAFQKNSSLVPRFNEAIGRSWEMINYYTQFYDLHGDGNRACSQEKVDHSAIFGLNVYQFTSSFVILLFGCSLGICACLYEIFKEKCKCRIHNFRKKFKIDIK